MNELGIKDKQQAKELLDVMTAVMSSLYMEDGGASRPEVIARQVSALAKTEEGRKRLYTAASQLAGG